MQIVIEIPEAFEGHFKQDRFKDNFERILEDCKHSAILSGIYEFETIEMLIRAFENGTPLPEHKGRLMLIDIDELPFFRCPNNVNKCPPYYDFTCQHCDYGITSRFRIERMGTLIESKKEKENE